MVKQQKCAKVSKNCENYKNIVTECEEMLRKYPKDRLLKDFEVLKKKLYIFKYIPTAYTNDIREGYMQFQDDADTFLEVYHKLTLAIIKIIDYYNIIKESTDELVRQAEESINIKAVQRDKLIEQGIDPDRPLAIFKAIEEQVSTKAAELLRRKKNLDKAEEEIAITEGVLAERKSEMEKALQHRYTLTESQKRTLIDEKDKILDGIEQWGSISGALRHDKSITSKSSTIQLYANQFPEFGEAIAVSKALFRDRLDGIMIERAIEGTENPVFGKGEHIGDYKIKDNKLLTELLKAKIPEQYNKKSTENVKNTQINNLNITSFANVDETKKGFTRDVGVVLDVDETGRVTRIQQEKKMVEFYDKKPGAEIITPEEEKKDGN